jgi:hypothetical protein
MQPKGALSRKPAWSAIYPDVNATPEYASLRSIARRAPPAWLGATRERAACSGRTLYPDAVVTTTLRCREPQRETSSARASDFYRFFDSGYGVRRSATVVWRHVRALLYAVITPWRRPQAAHVLSGSTDTAPRDYSSAIARRASESDNRAASATHRDTTLRRQRPGTRPALRGYLRPLEQPPGAPEPEPWTLAAGSG